MLTQKELKSILKYDPDTGVFTWLVSNRYRDQKGTVVKVGVKGRVTYNDVQYRLRRLAFLYMTGKVPENVVHINKDPKDLRWSNLRESTTHHKAKLGRSGLIGVYITAKIYLDGKLTNIGQFATAEDAARAYDKAAKKRDGKVAILNFPEEAVDV